MGYLIALVVGFYCGAGFFLSSVVTSDDELTTSDRLSLGMRWPWMLAKIRKVMKMVEDERELK